MRFFRRSLAGLFLISLTLGLLALAGNTLYSALQERWAQENRPAFARERVFSAEVTTLQIGNATPVLTAFGEIRSRRTLELRAPAAGTVMTLAEGFENGGEVAAGALLLQIDPAEAQSARDVAAADLREAENSLRRLGTDRIDLYFVHRFDDATPMEETLRALDDLVTQGKVLYPAVSNWAAWQIAKSLGVSAQEGLASFACIQPMYNLTKRQAEVEILPLAQAEGLAVIPYSPLGGGLLSGKYGASARPDSGRLMDNAMYAKRYGAELHYEVAERFTAYAKEKGIHPATLAVAWVGAHPGVTAPIIGARNVGQLEASLAAADVDMTPAWWAEIAALSYDPGIATDRSEEKG